MGMPRRRLTGERLERQRGHIRHATAVRAAMPRCAGTRSDGQPCRMHVREPGDRCRYHHAGAQRRDWSPRQRAAVMARRRAWRWRDQIVRAAPAALRARPEWQTAERARLHRARYRLAVAWPALLDGDPGPWQEACQALTATLDRARAHRDAGRSDGGICARLGI